MAENISETSQEQKNLKVANTGAAYQSENDEPLGHGLLLQLVLAPLV
jgi:hypothetical protein